jgi:putative heme degradation protein
MRRAPPDPPRDARPTTGPRDPRVPDDVSTEPGDGALSRVDAVKDEHLRRWDVATPAATLIGRPESPDADLPDSVRQLHAEAHPAMAGHSERMHRLEKLRITHAFANTLDVTPWERDRALGIVQDLDLTAFGSQRAVERVALVVLAHVVDEVRQQRLGLDDREWLNSLSPSAMSMLYDRHDSLTDDEQFQALLEEHDLDTTAVNRLKRTLREQLDEQELEGAVFARNPHRDPALPAFTSRPEDEGDGADDG